VGGRQTLDAIDGYLTEARRFEAVPDAILLDAHAMDRHGGTGTIAPWELLATYRPGLPVILAGGLTPGNVGQAIRTVRPDAVDVASGVERSPGRKDPELMRRFVDAAREAFEALPCSAARA
jgi:phosphoribosylanthranilate isomerase